MRTNWRKTAASQLATERRTREHEAPRLRSEVPDLLSLALEIDECRHDTVVVGARHTRRIVVETAPALFLLPCHDEHCVEGGYDLTHEIMRNLRARREEFHGEEGCSGRLSNDACGRLLRYRALATYKSETFGGVGGL